MSSDQQPIAVSFELALSDLLAARRFLLLRSTASWPLPVLVGALLAQALSIGSWIPAAVALGIFALGIVWLLYFQPRRAFLASPNVRGRQTWMLGPDGLSCEVAAADGARLGRSELEWRAVMRVRESSQAFLLSASRRTVYVLPKRAFDPTAVDRVRALLAAKVASTP